MDEIPVLIAYTQRDVKAWLLAEQTERSAQLTVAGGRILHVAEIDGVLATIPVCSPCALVLIGPHEETRQPAAEWLIRRRHLVVCQVSILGDIVHLSMSDPRLSNLLLAVRHLTEHVAASTEPSAPGAQCSSHRPEKRRSQLLTPPPDWHFLSCAIESLHALLGGAVKSAPRWRRRRCPTRGWSRDRDQLSTSEAACQRS